MSTIKYPESVKSELLQLLQTMMTDSSYDQFSLAGGTSLSLRFGHRTSVDIDFFTGEPFDSILLQDQIASDFSGSQILNRTKGSLCVNVCGIKIDLLYHPYPLLGDIEIDGCIRIMSLADVSAMKINAVTNRGSKKDFIDLYTLHMNGIQLQQCIENFCTKYNGNKLLAIRSLLWMQDADQEPDPVFLHELTWASVRKTMLRLADALQ
jgi:hypothetical protein